MSIKYDTKFSHLIKQIFKITCKREICNFKCWKRLVFQQQAYEAHGERMIGIEHRGK